MSTGTSPFATDWLHVSVGVRIGLRNRRVAPMPAIERDLSLPTDVDSAWDLLTDAEELQRWLGADVDLDPTPGATGAVVDHDGTRRRVVVHEVVPGRRLAWHWAVEGADGQVGPVSRVALTLTPEDDRTHLVVTEEPLERAPVQASASAAATSGAAWSHRLLHLEALLLVAAAVRG